MPDLACNYQVIRMKGRLWLKGKVLPLQLQMVGPRLMSWFEPAPENVWQPKNGGIELVVLSLQEDAAESIKAGIENKLHS